MSFAVASTASLRAPVAFRGKATARRPARVAVRPPALRPSHRSHRAIGPPVVTWRRCTSSTLTARPPRPIPDAQASAPTHQHPRPSVAETRAGRSAIVDRIASGAVALATALTLATSPANAISLPEEEATKLICDAECEATINDKELFTTSTGLQYRDIVVGDGVQPEVGFQVVVDYIAKNEQGQIFDNSLEKGKPNDVRITGLGQGETNVIPGLDEGILTMRSGGVRRLYIPGDLAFPKGLASAPGRPRISPFSPVVFDVKLLYIPGLE